MILTPLFHRLYRKMPPEARERARQRIVEPARPTAAFYLLVCLSAIIATFGLLANSTAVVIGAMLVAPLMSPIFGIALGLSTGDHKLLKTAILAETAGIFLAVLLPSLIGLIPLRPDFGAEIIARTQPTIYDVLIALASGLAGAYALVDEKISPALPGVAIATALVPPLAVCGLNIAAGSWSLAGGAFLLFTVNFIAIEFAAAFVFMWFGLAAIPQASNGSIAGAIFQRLGISFLILLLAAAFMTQTLIRIVGENRLEKQIRTVLTSQLTNYAGARLSDLSFEQSGSELQVMATIITPQEFGPNRVISMQKALQITVNPHSELVVRSLLSKDSDINGPVFVSQEEIKQRVQADEETAYMNRISQALGEQMRTVIGAEIIEISKELNNGLPVITVSVRTPQAITPDEVQLMQQYLQENVDVNLHLIVRSVITQDADANAYLYTAPDFSASLDGPDLELYNRLSNEIKWYLSQRLSGVVVEKLTFEHTDPNTVTVNTTVRTPVTLEPPLVAELQGHLALYIDPRIKLTIISEVGGTATAERLYQLSESNLP